MKKNLISMITIISMISGIAMGNQMGNMEVLASDTIDMDAQTIKQEEWEVPFQYKHPNYGNLITNSSKCTMTQYNNGIVEIEYKIQDVAYYREVIELGQLVYSNNVFEMPVYVDSNGNEHEYLYDALPRTGAVVYNVGDNYMISFKKSPIVSNAVYDTYWSPGENFIIRLYPKALSVESTIVAFGHIFTINNLWGDINGDGKINAEDSTCILRYSAYVGTGGDKSLREYLIN